ncbi:MAG: GTPase Era [Clostridiales bacterium]|nr:GTPase Era [Clostridiales bacterium]
MKSGFVAILGLPNVGKSTLLNALLKEKVSIVSPKPQTTRNKILGILNEDDSQIVFIDTPGIHNAHNKLDEYMNKAISVAKDDVDVVLFVIDGTKKINDNVIDTLNKYTKGIDNVILVVNKIDDTTYEKLYPELSKCNSLDNVKDIVPISAKKSKNLEELLKVIKQYLKDDVRYFDEDIYTDQSIKFLCSEIIREKALWLLQDELPHGIAIEIARFDDGETLCEIDADIIIEKASHKQIIIGKGGAMLKNIGIKSRQDIEKLVDKKVMLKLFVKVREDWRTKSNTIKALGYNSQDL